MVTLIDATLSLALELTVLPLLLAAVMLKNRKRFRQHGITMATSVILHLIAILTVMVPSFSVFFTSPGTIAIDPLVIFTFIHVALGLAAVVSGIWLVASWHLKKDVSGCFTRKKFMKPTLTIWVTAILLGVTLYIAIWASQLFQ
jgi:uncharacterized membrane protein YozB (DUF420 family)